jgi:hypothetical protein
MEGSFAVGVDFEHRWSQIVGQRNFAQTTRTMQRLLDEHDPKESRS